MGRSERGRDGEKDKIIECLTKPLLIFTTSSAYYILHGNKLHAVNSGHECRPNVYS